MANSQNVLSMLNKCFNPEDAVTIYTVALIHFIQGFTYMKDIHSCYDMSILSVKYPKLKLGYDSLSKLYDSLGRRQCNVLKFEENLVSSCSRQIAIDGHVIASEHDFHKISEFEFLIGSPGHYRPSVSSLIYHYRRNARKCPPENVK